MKIEQVANRSVFKGGGGWAIKFETQEARAQYWDKAEGPCRSYYSERSSKPYWLIANNYGCLQPET